MTEAEDDIRGRFEQFIKARQIKIKPWAEAAGVAQGAIHNYTSGRTASLTYSTLEKLAKAEGVTVGEMLSEPQRKPEKSSLIAIKRLEVHATKSGGFEVAVDPKGEPLHLRKELVTRIITDHHGALRVTQFSGNSMQPTIQDGDLGVVLTGPDPVGFQNGRVYALWDGQSLIVKRLETVVSTSPRLRVISDNRCLYEPYEIDASEAQIIGRILWRIGKI